MADKILANVGGIPVMESEVDSFIASLGERAQGYNTKEGRAAVLTQIISNKLLLLDARRNLLEQDPKFRAELNRMKEQLLVNFAAEKLLSDIKVSDDEALKYYEDNKENFRRGETVSASHILVDTEERAKEIYNEIKDGKISFEDAARANSSCPSKDNGGSLGTFSRGQMVAEFDTAVFSMQVGEITSEPVKTQFGYHLIKLDAKNEPSVVAYEEIADRIKGMLLSEKQEKAYDSRINQLKILYPVDMANS